MKSILKFIGWLIGLIVFVFLLELNLFVFSTNTSDTFSFWPWNNTYQWGLNFLQFGVLILDLWYVWVNVTDLMRGN